MQQTINLSTIAQIIYDNWTNIYFGAVPYLDAMLSLNDINDKYGDDSAKSIVCYFLANAQTWQVPVAKEIKQRLNKLVKEAK